MIDIDQARHILGEDIQVVNSIDYENQSKLHINFIDKGKYQFVIFPKNAEPEMQITSDLFGKCFVKKKIVVIIHNGQSRSFRITDATHTDDLYLFELNELQNFDYTKSTVPYSTFHSKEESSIILHEPRR